jgi:hypothetical protein
LGGGLPGPIRAAEVERRDAPPGPSAFERAARSALFPAWGQITNGKPRKGAILFGIQTYLYTRIIVESRAAGEADRLSARLEREGADPGEIALVEGWAENHYDRRRDLFFWAILAGFYGALDAYIDAHLGDIDRELEEGRGLFARVDPSGEPAVEVGWRY